MTHSKLRRLISVPAVMLSCLLLWQLAPLWLPIALVYDHFTGRSWARALAFFAWLTLMETLGIIGLGALWLASFVIREARFLQLNFSLQCWWAAWLWQGAKLLFNAKLEVENAALSHKTPFILVPRHNSIADTLLPQLLISGPRDVRLRYVLKSELLWEPCLDIAGNRLPNVFINRSAANSEQELAAIRAGVANLNSGEGVVIYPEGTRFSAARQAKIQKRLRAKFGDDYADLRLQNVLPARPAGLFTLIDTLPQCDVLFLAHSGFESFRSLQQLTNGSAVGTVCRCAFWRVAASDIPQQAQQRLVWLQQQWSTMDAKVAAQLAAT